MKHTILALLLGLMMTGCATKNSKGAYGDDSGQYSTDSLAGGVLADATPAQSDQKLIWTGSITLEVGSLTNAANQVVAQTKAVGGYVESRSYGDGIIIYYGETSPTITLGLRIPSDKLEQVLGDLEGMGKVKSKSLSSEDVTERYIDTETRLATKKKLRDRLKELLGKAVDVKDVLAIEKELNRIQADIDSMTARLKSMKGKVDYASLSVTLEAEKQERVLGPLGYVWEGAKWCVLKLFVWQDEGYVEQQ